MSPELFEKWEHIVEDVDKTKVPVEFIRKLIVRMRGRKQRTINIRTLLKQGLEPDEIEEVVHRTLDELDEDMVGIEFELDIESIAETVQPHTDDILKKL